MTGALDWARDGPHWPHRTASRFVDAGGCRWHVQVHRAAPARPVLWLLHGTGAASHSWRGLVPLLAPHATLVERWKEPQRIDCDSVVSSL